MEEWKDIKGFEGLYQVSTSGQVRSLDRVVTNGSVSYKKLGRIISSSNNGTGYLFINLSKNGKHKRVYIHRLVADAFLNNPYNYPQVNHKDENKANNCVSNLEWCDSKYNNNYGTRLKRLSKSRGKVVAQYTLSGSLVRCFDSINQAALSVNRTPSNIRECIKGNVLSSGGYMWKLVQGDVRKNIDKCILIHKHIKQYTIAGEFVQEYKSASEAERITGIKKQQICKVCNKAPKYHTAGGFIWKFKE